MKRILYIAPYFWPEEIGSAPYCSDLAQYLADKGHQVQAIAFRPHYPDPSPFTAWSQGQRDKESWSGIDIERVAAGNRGNGGFRSRVSNDLRFLLYLFRTSIARRQRGVDAIVAYVPSVLTLYGAKVVQLLTRAPIIAVVHDIESGLASSLGIAKGSLLLRLMRLVERVGLNFARTVVVLTEGMAGELRKIGCRRPIEVISIWAAVGDHVPVDAHSDKILMYSGNFGKKQNIDQLLPLMHRLSQSEEGLAFILRGDGSERERIEGEVRELGIKNVSFLPLVPAEQLTEALQAAHLHLVPQANNVANYALPSKLFSIMAAGRPFVCIAKPGSPLDKLTVRSGAGICVPTGNIDLLYEAVASLLKDIPRQRRMGENGRMFIEAHMNRSEIFKAYENLIMS